VEKGLLVGEQERFLSSNVGLFTDMHREFHNLLFRRFRRYSTATPQPLPPPIGDIFLTMVRGADQWYCALLLRPPQRHRMVL
jgi:hypothetical protein